MGMRIGILAVVLFGAWAAGSAVAEKLPVENGATSAGQPALWEIRGAMFNRYGPSYPGSESSQLNVVPLPLPIYRGKFLRLFEDNEKPLRGRLFARDTVKLELDIDLQFPSDSKDINARTNMPDLDLLLELGPELEIEFARQSFAGSWYATFGARLATSWDGLDPKFQGFAFSPELKYLVDVTPRDELKLRITPTFATTDYMDYYYTVAPVFATADRSAYSADPGYLGTNLTGNWSHNFSDRMSFFIGLRYSLYAGATNNDSPLHTDNTGYSVYGAIQYKFWESKRRAPERKGVPNATNTGP